MNQKDVQSPSVLQPMFYHMIFYTCNAILFHLICMYPLLKDYSLLGLI
jgi:hypothetical protein